ncbi:hypothetical protein [Methylovorus glucosotrophus]|jgi:hypothetical protein|uniref:Uncharacterized protein n=1 Tax=Methylovorus glucosotrophus (strain SIP3-4) TaxID=582744 RepID=C6XBL2_METGS|nr:hypothetical protein [Methylovorus glucosotrophus]ACT51982.1 hypothetical protein Msip34_2745 [Methylovorus glucosotrophus SIP3-4]
MRKETFIFLSSSAVVLIIIGIMLELGVAQQRASIITTRYAHCEEAPSLPGTPSSEGCQLEVKDYTKNGDLLVFLDKDNKQGMLPSSAVKSIVAQAAPPFSIFRNIYLLIGVLLLPLSIVLYLVSKRGKSGA